MSFNYKQYLASREWALKKEALRERSKGLCERCTIGKYEETHHVTYERIGREPLEDLLAVCSACHQYLSAKTDVDPVDHIGFLVIALDLRNSQSKRGLVPFLADRQIRLVGVVNRRDIHRVFKQGIESPVRPEWEVDVLAGADIA